MIKVLQVGSTNWADQGEIPTTMKWSFNQLERIYDVAIITEAVEFDQNFWEKLQWHTNPYCMFYLPGVFEQLSTAAQTCLKLNCAEPFAGTKEQFYALVYHSYFPGQSGIAISPLRLIINHAQFATCEQTDGFHLDFEVAQDTWTTLGSYQDSLYVDPGRSLSSWLEYQADNGVQVRLVINDALNYPDLYWVREVDHEHELTVDLPVSEQYDYLGITVQVKGHGHLRLGTIHYRWHRFGKGAFLPGGKRLIDPQTNEEIAYFFNPGDLKAPLNIYFAGARTLEGFEAYPAMRKTHAPALLFTDPRLDAGQFYTGQVLEQKIIDTIKQTVQQLGLSMDQVIINGISMGSYAAIKFGAKLQVHAINVAKLITNLGLVAKRFPLERPTDFATSLDIALQNTSSLSEQDLTRLDQEFWEHLSQSDLSQTRIFAAYMQEDDYDNLAIKQLTDLAKDQSKQLITQGFHGHHNDAPEITAWFLSRLHQIMKEDFKR